MVRTLVQRNLSKKIGTRWTCEALILRRNTIELRGIQVANGPGQWTSPFSLRIGRFSMQFRLLGFLSLVPELTVCT